MEYNLASMTSLPLLFIALLTCTRNSILAKADLVTEICKQTPNVQLCLSTLRADSRSKTADTTLLGIIMVDALNVKTIAVVEQIEKLSLGSSTQMKVPLDKCTELYILSEGGLQDAVEALLEGNLRNAEDDVKNAGMKAGDCEKRFGAVGLKSPLTNMNKNFMDLSAIASAIIRMLF